MHRALGDRGCVVLINFRASHEQCCYPLELAVVAGHHINSGEPPDYSSCFGDHSLAKTAFQIRGRVFDGMGCDEIGEIEHGAIIRHASCHLLRGKLAISQGSVRNLLSAATLRATVHNRAIVLKPSLPRLSRQLRALRRHRDCGIISGAHPNRWRSRIDPRWVHHFDWSADAGMVESVVAEERSHPATFEPWGSLGSVPTSSRTSRNQRPRLFWLAYRRWGRASQAKTRCRMHTCDYTVQTQRSSNRGRVPAHQGRHEPVPQPATSARARRGGLPGGVVFRSQSSPTNGHSARRSRRATRVASIALPSSTQQLTP